MNTCVLCKTPMDENCNGKFCPRGCDCIPEPIGIRCITKTVQVFDSQAFTKPTAIVTKCCANPEIAPFELRGGVTGKHCWTCGKVFS